MNALFFFDLKFLLCVSHLVANAGLGSIVLWGIYGTLVVKKVLCSRKKDTGWLSISTFTRFIFCQSFLPAGRVKGFSLYHHRSAG